MFKVFFLSFDYFSSQESSNLDDAKDVARKAGFQSVIYNPSKEIVCSYCPLTGFKNHG